MYIPISTKLYNTHSYIWENFNNIEEDFESRLKYYYNMYDNAYRPELLGFLLKLN